MKRHNFNLLFFFGGGGEVDLYKSCNLKKYNKLNNNNHITITLAEFNSLTKCREFFPWGRVVRNFHFFVGGGEGGVEL